MRLLEALEVLAFMGTLWLAWACMAMSLGWMVFGDEDDFPSPLGWILARLHLWGALLFLVVIVWGALRCGP